ncbi:MAG TPA: tripartite tricarboxylate transporter substrate binding protein [Xanthobacteraceae bacterium]|nr:tripartite tricarboxylate transporter substrate binding protein [Xanthobacteraceae bacterium]
MRYVARRLSIVVLWLLALATTAAAQSYPDRVIRIINPFPPGGSVDITARLLAQKLSENLGHQVIVENRAGAGGNAGADSVAKAEPDGYTLLFTAPGPLVVNQTLYSKGLPFDPTKDFAPIAIFAFTPIVLMVNPGVPAKDVQELIAYAKSNPGKVYFGSAGMGSTPHLSGELFKSMTGTELTHVPYRGTGPAMNDLVGGHIQMFFDLLPGSLPQISGGKVRALANAGAKRPPALPDLPTVAEQGLPGFDSASWVALVAPAKTPPAVLAKLREEVGKAIASPDIVARIRELGSDPGTASEKDVRAFLDAETKKWAEVIRVSGAKAD